MQRDSALKSAWFNLAGRLALINMGRGSPPWVTRFILTSSSTILSVYPVISQAQFDFHHCQLPHLQT